MTLFKALKSHVAQVVKFWNFAHIKVQFQNNKPTKFHFPSLSAFDFVNFNRTHSRIFGGDSLQERMWQVPCLMVILSKLMYIPKDTYLLCIMILDWSINFETYLISSPSKTEFMKNALCCKNKSISLVDLEDSILFISDSNLFSAVTFVSVRTSPEIRIRN